MDQRREARVKKLQELTDAVNQFTDAVNQRNPRLALNCLREMETLFHVNYPELNEEEWGIHFARMVLNYLGSLAEPEMKDLRDWFIEWLIKRWGQEISISTTEIFGFICQVLSALDQKEFQSVKNRFIKPHLAAWGPISLANWYNRSESREIREVIRDALVDNLDFRAFKRSWR